MKKKNLLLIILSASVFMIFSCRNEENTSTAEDRALLFDYIIQKTQEREAFSPVKNKIMNYDPVREMMQYRQEMINAETDLDLYSVLIKISNARRDRHLSIGKIDGGLNVDAETEHRAPVLFRVDYSSEGDYFFFIGDFAENISEYTDESPELGDKLTRVNNKPIDEYFEEMRPYVRYSTIIGLWETMAEDLNLRSINYPMSLNSMEVSYTFEKPDGQEYILTLPYTKPDKIEWTDTYKSHGENRYKGFERLLDRETFDVYTSSEHPDILLIDWYGFRENLAEDMDFLVEYASENNMLNYNLIWDGTRSRGGSRGAYAVQRFFPERFKTTYGNLRISDVTPLFIEEREESFKKNAMLDEEGVQETDDDGTWLMDWLREDVKAAILNGDEYSNNVPFKLAHLPKDSDGIIDPAVKHFSGKAVCFFGPHGGSHLDQFSSIVIDNDLAYTIGMPTGGYSNTWEWSEDLKFPLSGDPVVEFMWNIGHTIRPNGEILEGNPALVDKYIPEGRDNYLDYYDLLLREAFNYFGN